MACKRHTRVSRAAASGLLAATVLVSCQEQPSPPDPPVAASPSPRQDVIVTEISLGRALDPDRRVSQPQSAFAPADTVYASVVTQGSARRGALEARWTYQGSELLAESDLDIVPSGTTVSEFHISKPDGLPRGSYRVEIFLDGAAVGERTFSVE
jgi:hypothetical protein